MDSQFWATYLDKKSEYEKGYADATEKAWEWIKNTFIFLKEVAAVDVNELEDTYRKTMEE